MDLKRFHILFITLATLCFVGFGLWCIASGSLTGAAAIVGGTLGLLLGLATALYGIWFYRTKIRPLEGATQTAAAGPNR